MIQIARNQTHPRYGKRAIIEDLECKFARGFTLVEMLIGVSIIITIGAIAIPGYFKMIKAAKVTRAAGDITSMAAQISVLRSTMGVYPSTLNDAGIAQRTDPWGRPYCYLVIEGLKDKGHVRKDRKLVPLNSDFDLYSLGEDGDSSPPITAKGSQDDIIRANNGGYVGLAENY
jgi:general secretion pathway protein G